MVRIARTPRLGSQGKEDLDLTVEALRVSRVSKIYGRSYALRDVDLRVERGEFVGLFGPNGAGKSTLLRICAALLRPSTGGIEVFGGDPWRELQRRSAVGFLGHGIGLYPNLTVRENLNYFARLAGVSVPRTRVAEIIERLELGVYADAEVRCLSRGWQQRAAIARGLLGSPRLLLWDEPFSGLDERTSKRMADLLKEWRAAGEVAGLISSHDYDRTMEICGRATVMDRGRIAFDGGADEGRATYRRIMGITRERKDDCR